MKNTENTRVDVLSRKLEYKDKKKSKDFVGFRKDKDNLTINYYQLISIIRINSNPFTDKIKITYNNNIVAENIS
jgi:hypothetical protein